MKRRAESATTLEANVPQALRKYLDRPEVLAGFDNRAALIALGEDIRAMRTQAGLTQEGLASLIGSTQPEIVRLEKGLGKNGPTFYTLAKVGMALKQRVVVGFEPVDAGAKLVVESEGLDVEPLRSAKP
jgi:DNA-binding XRE family transcriptional regulator